MSYPKPLSEKSLKRLYTQTGLSTEAYDFLHSLFAACANLYGAISLRDVWSVYRELNSAAPRIRRQDLIAFSAIVRREVQPYRVYEIEELYTEEPHNDLDRHIVSKELIGTGYGKMLSFYALMEGLGNHPYCVPDNFLSYTAAECAPRQRKAYPNENRGTKLGTFSFLNLSERFDLEYYKKVPATYSALLEEYSGTEAEKIMRQHRWDENIGRLHTTEIIQNLENELHEVGVRLTEKQQDTLMRLIVQYHNGSRLWCLRGWKPNELADMHGNSGVPSISFGPGLQQAFADGIMDKGDLVRKIQELGWKVME